MIGRSSLGITFLKQMTNCIPNPVSEIGTGPGLLWIPLSIWRESEFPKWRLFICLVGPSLGPPPAPVASRLGSLLMTSHAIIDPRLHDQASEAFRMGQSANCLLPG
jgi:hypothetical protein